MPTFAKHLSILRMGSAEPEMRAKHGDYVEMVRARLSLAWQQTAQVIDPETGELPRVEEVHALVITGSSSMVTEPSASDLRAFEWLRQVVEAQVPVLGLCYGHQMLGHVLGGSVGPLPGGPEIGVAAVSMDAEGDPIFAASEPQQDVAVIHWQTILKLPPGARVVGVGERDPHQAVRFTERVWGVQFHPEFTVGLMTDYVAACAKDIAARGENPDTVAKAMAQWTGDKTEIVARFSQWALGK